MAIERFNRSRKTDEAGLVGRATQSATPPGTEPSGRALSTRGIVCIARWNRMGESLLVSICASVRTSREYHRVNPSVESAAYTHARTVRIPRNSTVNTIVLIFIALVARAAIHSNYDTSIPGGVSTRSAFKPDLWEQIFRVDGLITDRRRADQVAKNN